MEQLPTTFRRVLYEQAALVESRQCCLCGEPVVASPDGTVPLLGETTVTAMDYVGGIWYEDDWVTQLLGPLCPACAEEEE